jgi:alkylation response protein AidB-like acyl-CoA dehydrogenase
LFADSGFTDRYNALALDIQDLGSLFGRFVEQVKRGEPLGEDISMLKIWTTETWQRITEMLVETGAEDGALAGQREIDGVDADILSSFYYSRPGTIFGGSSEVQRNILARYVLKLPA